MGIKIINTLIFCLVVIAAGGMVSIPRAAVLELAGTSARSDSNNTYAGSKSCRECHERFYQLWSGSFHGLAMQPYTTELAKAKITPQLQPIAIGDHRYQADLAEGSVVESGDGASKHYQITYVMGGKYVYYFLTSLPKGRLQTLPISYDVRRKEWFDTSLSGVRHFPDQLRSGVPISWKSVAYTFNTACRDCHVSQRENSYDPQTDSFTTSWKEPGINCETCHGPSEEHNTTMRTLPKGQKPVDYKIIRTKPFTPSQHNDACNSCHAKMSHLTRGYRPLERFFDHFDVVTLEDPDYYPDGRDLGENYTTTSWMLNVCAQKSPLHCVSCHTSSGRYRFRKPEDADKACLPCHAERVKNVSSHSHHPEKSAGSRCISCHMPKTEFARIDRSDHSFLPPAPAATIRFKSPNACNLCHVEKDAVWADRQVRKWHPRDYQAPVLHRAGLVDAARKRDWSRLPEMLAYITAPARNEIFAASLIRLLDVANDSRTVPVLIRALKDPSPLVRASAADTLGKTPTPEALQALLVATADEYRLVRVAAAGVVSLYPEATNRPGSAEHAGRAIDEYLAALRSRPLNWIAHYNLGNYHLSNKRMKEALGEYEAALKLEPMAAMALVNSATASFQLGNAATAEEYLKKAIALDPKIAVAHYNLGLVNAGLGRMEEAEKNFRETLKADPSMADAAFNLCRIVAAERAEEAISWCRGAVAAAPMNPGYAYYLSFLQFQAGDMDGARSTAASLMELHPTFGDAYLLAGGLEEQEGRFDAAIAVYHRLQEVDGVAERYRAVAGERLEAIMSSRRNIE